MKREKSLRLEIILHIIVILIFVGLCFRIYIDSEKYDCENCIVSFKHQRPIFGDPDFRKTYEVNTTAIELYEGFIKDKCPIFWDKTNGYMKNG